MTLRRVIKAVWFAVVMWLILVASTCVFVFREALVDRRSRECPICPDLDLERLAAGMNAYELRANDSIVVETNLGHHRKDCIHVEMVAAEYSKLS